MPLWPSPTSRRVAIICVVLVASAACGRLHPSDTKAGPADEFDARLRHALQSVRQPPFVTSDKEGKRLWQQTRAFY